MPPRCAHGLDLLIDSSCRAVYRCSSEPLEHTEQLQPLALTQPVGACGVFHDGFPDDVALGLAEARSCASKLFNGLVVQRECGLNHTATILPYQLAVGPPPVVSSRVDILNRQDEIVRTVEGREELGVDGLIERAVPLSTLLPGSYLLKVTAGEGVRLVTREIGIAVRVSP